MEYSYRYTHAGVEEDSGLENITTPVNHDSYSKDSRSRFAGDLAAYGELP